MFCFVAAEVVDEGNAGIIADADNDSGSEGDCARIKEHSDDHRLFDEDVSDDEGIDTFIFAAHNSLGKDHCIVGMAGTVRDPKLL